MAKKKTYIEWSQNVGGLNYASTPNAVELMELADCQNVELSPIGGYRRRGGTAVMASMSGTTLPTMLHWASFPSGVSFLMVGGDDDAVYRMTAATVSEITEFNFLA